MAEAFSYFKMALRGLTRKRAAAGGFLANGIHPTRGFSILLTRYATDMRCEILHFGTTLPEQNLRKKQIEPSLRDRISLESSLPKKLAL